MAPNWRRLLTSAISEEELKALRAHERTGRPLGDENFLALLEQNLGRILRRQKPGPKNVQARCVCCPRKPSPGTGPTRGGVRRGVSFFLPPPKPPTGPATRRSRLPGW